MKALSIRQPWAHAILNLGKDIENRDWWTKYRGPVLIHAGLRADTEAYADIKHILEAIGEYPPEGIDRRRSLPLGGIVGRADIVDCVSSSGSPWFFGRYGFVIKNALPLPFRPCKGALGFFDVEASEEARAG